MKFSLWKDLKFFFVTAYVLGFYFSFFMISPTSQQTRSLNWLRKHRPLDGSVEIRDVTSAYAGINVIGPHAPQLLYDVSGINTSRQEFKQMTCKVG